MQFLYPGEADAYYGRVLGILIFSFVAIGISYIFGTLLTAAGKIFQLNKIFLFGILINLALNLSLIPFYKATGAAIATVTTQFFVMIGQVLLAYRIFPWKIRYSKIAQNAGFIIISLLIFSGFTTLAVLPWWGNMLLGSMSCILVSLLIKFIDIGEFKQIILSKE